MFKPWQVILFLLIVILAVVGFIFWYYSTPGVGNVPEANPVSVATTTAAEASPATDTASVSTDAALDADLGIIDTQMKMVDTNAAAVDTSLTDKPVAQTE